MSERFEFAWRRPKVLIYKAADRRFRVGLNRLTGVVIGAYVHVGNRVLSARWGRAVPVRPLVDQCHNGHPFEPGIDIDDPTNPSLLWCNACGEARRPPAASSASPEGNPDQ